MSIIDLVMFYRLILLCNRKALSRGHYSDGSVRPSVRPSVARLKFRLKVFGVHVFHLSFIQLISYLEYSITVYLPLCSHTFTVIVIIYFGENLVFLWYCRDFILNIFDCLRPLQN